MYVPVFSGPQMVFQVPQFSPKLDPSTSRGNHTRFQSRTAGPHLAPGGKDGAMGLV